MHRLFFNPFFPSICRIIQEVNEENKAIFQKFINKKCSSKEKDTILNIKKINTNKNAVKQFKNFKSKRGI